jgi:hypothetical protein
MRWQDVVLASAGFIAALSLLPTIQGSNKPHLKTSVISGTLVSVVSLTMLSLNLWIGAFANSLVAVAWFVIAWQTFRARAADVESRGEPASTRAVPDGHTCTPGSGR